LASTRSIQIADVISVEEDLGKWSTVDADGCTTYNPVPIPGKEPDTVDYTLLVTTSEKTMRYYFDVKDFNAVYCGGTKTMKVTYTERHRAE